MAKVLSKAKPKIASKKKTTEKTTEKSAAKSKSRVVFPSNAQVSEVKPVVEMELSSKKDKIQIVSGSAKTVTKDQSISNMDRHELEVEISRLKKMVADMRSRMEIVDPVSGLPKRGRFMELAGAEFARTRRYDHKLTLLVAKIPGLKRITDMRGREASDQVITAVSEICVASTRFGVDILGRIDEDKIAMLLPETDIEGGNKCLVRMRKLVAAMPITIDGERVKVGLHIAARPLKKSHSSFVELLVTA